MEAYTDFAGVYDIFMDHTPYEEWAAFLQSRLSSYGIEDGLVLDIGCGTGSLTELLSKAGYDMIGIDNSEEMLGIALSKRDLSGEDILYLVQDMRELELYGTVRAAVSVCDSINYLLEEAEIRDTFSLVNNYLDPKGIFIFDFNTVYKYEQVIGDAVIAENRDECSFIWENYYHGEEQINEYELTIFALVPEKKESRDVTYRKFTETHLQRGFSLEQIRRLLREAGMEFLEALDADTHAEVTAASERIYVVAREAGKQPRSARVEVNA